MAFASENPYGEIDLMLLRKHRLGSWRMTRADSAHTRIPSATTHPIEPRRSGNACGKWSHHQHATKPVLARRRQDRISQP